jgi:hypothetical protein
MAYQVLFNKLAFQKTKEGQPTVPDGPEVIRTRGEMVPEWVPTFQVSALASAGMVVFAADPDPLLRPVEEVPVQVRTPDQPVVLPSDPQGTPPTLADLLVEDNEPAPVTDPDVPVTPTGENPAAEPLPPLPKQSDSKDVWEAYATRPQIGMPLGEAEAMNKTDLVAEVKRRHAAATA